MISGGRWTTSARSAPSSIDMPMERRRSLMHSTSAMSGTLRNTKRPSASVVAAISLSTEFLAPLIGTDPDSGPDRRTRIVVIAASSLLLQPRRDDRGDLVILLETVSAIFDPRVRHRAGDLLGVALELVGLRERIP